MTELQLYKFIQKNNIEWHKHQNEGIEDVIIFPSLVQTIIFVKMIDDYLDEEGIECRLKEGYLAVWMKDICEYYDIEMNEIFEGKDWDSK